MSKDYRLSFIYCVPSLETSNSYRVVTCFFCLFPLRILKTSVKKRLYFSVLCVDTPKSLIFLLTAQQETCNIPAVCYRPICHSTVFQPLSNYTLWSIMWHALIHLQIHYTAWPGITALKINKVFPYHWEYVFRHQSYQVTMCIVRGIVCQPKAICYCKLWNVCFYIPVTTHGIKKIVCHFWQGLNETKPNYGLLRIISNCFHFDRVFLIQ